MKLSDYKKQMTEIDKKIEHYKQVIERAERNLEIVMSKRFALEQKFVPECDEYEDCDGGCETCELWINA